MKYTKIDDKRLRLMNACEEGREFVVNNCPTTDSVKVIEWLIKKDQLEWANWLMARVMDRKQCLAYAIYSAKKVLPIFEKRYPADTRPRKAIEAAEKVLKRNTKRNREAAAAASSSAYTAYYATYSDYARSARSAARSAAIVANNSAHYAAYAVHAAYYAYEARSAAGDKMRLKLLRYGIKLLKEGV